MRPHFRNFLATLSLLLVCQTLPGESDKQPVRIGAVYNLTGALASLGQPSLAGARLAVKQLNQRGGVLGRTVELIFGEGGSDPRKVAAVTTTLVHTANLSAITGLSDTSMALAAAPVAEKGRMVFLTSGATSPKVPIQFPQYYYMACFGDNTQAAAGAEYAYNTLGAKKAWVLFDNTTEYTILLAGYFKSRYTELGGTIAGEDTYAGGTQDFTTQIGHILAQPVQPPLLYISAGPDDIGRLVKQVRAAGLQQPIMGGDGYDTPLLLSTAGAAANNTYFTTHAFMDAVQGTAEVKQFLTDYQNEYGVKADSAFAALGYDAVMLVADAITRAGSAKQKEIPDALQATQFFPGVTGHISFAPGVHIPKKEVTIIKIDGGQLTLAAVVQPVKTPAP